MPRHPRVHAEGLLYHVIARGNNGQRIFLRQDDYEAFLEALRVVRERYPFYLYAYVLMSNHFHLLLEVQRSSTDRFHGTYPPNFNEGTHLISRKGPTQFQVVPFVF
jgi:REP element-mobilizing transposase RayT